MKKLVFSVFAIACLVFTGCSKDDDDKGKCATCNLAGNSLKACDNGDGTVTVSSGDQSEVLRGDDLEGTSAAEYVAALEQGCALLSN